jgi:S1-C subfamily serine protease
LDTEEAETGFYTFTQGIVCGKFRLGVTDSTPVDVLAITADYGKGSSGGPILNEHGAVVGIICQTRALFHDEDESEPQLTWKFSRPSSRLLALLNAPAKGK